MGVRILRGNDEAVMFCSTTDWAFGPVFSDDGNHSAEERIECFLRWLKIDPRMDDSELESKYSAWRAQEEAQWEAEEKAEEERLRDDE